MLCVLAPFRSLCPSLRLCVYGSFTFRLHPLSGLHRDIHLSARLGCSALRLSPTMASADFSQFVVTTAFSLSARPHGISPCSFLVYPPNLRTWVTTAFLGFVASGQLTRHVRLCIRFLFVGLRFRYPFLSPAPHDANLGSRFKVRWQLRLCGLSPQNTGMPVVP